MSDAALTAITVDAGLQAPEELRPPGWVDYGMKYTLGELHRDPAVTKAIEALDPTFTPIVIKWIWLAPADAQTGVREEHVFLYHGIGRTNLVLNSKGWTAQEAEDSQSIMRLPAVEIPPSYTGRIPKYLDPTVGILDDPSFLGLEKVFESPAEKFGAADLPGPFVPWDWNLVNALKRCYSSEHTITELKESQIFGPDRARREAQRKRALAFAHDYAKFQVWAHKKLETASEEEHKAAFEQAKKMVYQQELARQAARANFKLHGVN